MHELFFNIIVEDKNDLIIRFVLFPILTLFLFYISLLIMVRRKEPDNSKVKSNFLIDIQFSRFYSVISTLFFLNIYWFLLLYFNGLDKIKWNFVTTIDNIYLQLLPFLLCNIILILIYTDTKKKINTLL